MLRALWSRRSQTVDFVAKKRQCVQKLEQVERENRSTKVGAVGVQALERHVVQIEQKSPTFSQECARVLGISRSSARRSDDAHKQLKSRSSLLAHNRRHLTFVKNEFRSLRNSGFSTVKLRATNAATSRNSARSTAAAIFARQQSKRQAASRS